MIVQWCIKGLSLASDDEARSIVDSGQGIISNWWRTVHTITPAERLDKLTAANLDLHVNHFGDRDAATGRPFSELTPFISVSCGTVERDKVAQTNHVRTALSTALFFGTRFGAEATAYLYTCWLLLAPRSAVEIEGVAEEIRDLNAYRRYSAYQTEGEVTAKVSIPANQIQKCEKWVYDRTAKEMRSEWEYFNLGFVPPEILSNVRELI